MANFDEDGNLMLKLKDSAGRPAAATGQAVYQLIDDKYEGFVRAVRNNQTTLALEYAMHLIQEMSNDIYYLNEDIKKLKENNAAKKTPVKKASTRTKKQEADQEEASE